MWNSQNLRVPFSHSVSRKWDSRAFSARHSQTSCVQELLQAESATADRFPVWFRSATRVFDIVPACRPFVFLSLSHLLVGPPPLPLWAPLVPLSIHPFAPLFSFTLISAESYLLLSVSHVRCARFPWRDFSCGLVTRVFTVFHGFGPPGDLRGLFLQSVSRPGDTHGSFLHGVSRLGPPGDFRGPFFAKCFKDVGFGRPL